MIGFPQIRYSNSFQDKGKKQYKGTISFIPSLIAFICKSNSDNMYFSHSATHSSLLSHLNIYIKIIKKNLFIILTNIMNKNLSFKFL